MISIIKQHLLDKKESINVSELIFSKKKETTCE